MNDLIAGAGIALVIEGLLWALAPQTGKRMLAEIAKLEDGQLSMVAWVVVASGCFLVWTVRG